MSTEGHERGHVDNKNTICERVVCALTNTRSVVCFGQTTGAQVDAGVTPPRVFTLLI